MRTTLALVLSTLLCFSYLAHAQNGEQPYQIDEQATAQATWEPGSIIAEDNMSKDSKKPVIVYRKFIGVTDKGFYVVQDFHKKSNHKKTDPVVIMQFDRVKDFAINTLPIQGAYIQWFDDGQKWEEGQFQDGKQQGLWIEWYDNGQKRTEGQFLDGKRHGTYTLWGDDGEKITEQVYENGVLVKTLYKKYPGDIGLLVEF